LYAGSHDGKVLGRTCNALSLSAARLATGSRTLDTAGMYSTVIFFLNF
jgi:hypothetical protein